MSLSPQDWESLRLSLPLMFQRQRLGYKGIKVTGREGRDPVTASCVLQTIVSPRRMKRWSNCAVSVLGFAALPPLPSSSEERASEGFRGKTDSQNLNNLMPASV